MNPYKDLQRLRKTYKAFKAFHTGTTYCDYTPNIWSIELTTRCNLNCQKCARESVKNNRGYGDMSFNKYVNIIESYPDSLRSIRLFKHGEPMLYPRITDAVQVASEKPYIKMIGITTNGNFPTNKLRDLFDAGLSVISFSFDGTTKKDYEESSQGGNYELVKENILEACHLKETEFPDILIGVTIVYMNQSNKDMYDFIRNWRQYPLTINVLKLHSWVDNVSVEHLGYTKNQVIPETCFCPYFSVVIYYNGDVVPCCIWLTKPLGNVFRDNLNDIWNNDEYMLLRKQLSVNRKSVPYCSRCPSIVNEEPYDIHKRNRFFPIDKSLYTFIRNATKRRI